MMTMHSPVSPTGPGPERAKGAAARCQARAPLAAFLAGTLAVVSVSAENLLPNGRFEKGADTPDGWRLAGGRGGRVGAADFGRPGIRVEGDGKDESSWRSDAVRLEPQALYHLRFLARRESGASGGAAVAGPTRVNRDLRFGDAWQRYGFVFSAPDLGSEDVVRLGQWHVAGGLVFAEAELFPVLAAHASLPGGVELGEGESVRGGTYRFAPDFGWEGANYHRPLIRNRAGFNSNRWGFARDAEVVYRLGLRGSLQEKARVRAALSGPASARLKIEASRDNQAWSAVGELDENRRDGWSPLPADLFPAGDIFIRLSLEGGQGSCQVNAFEYEAGLTNAPADADGSTWFMDIVQSSPKLGVSLESLQLADELGPWRCTLALTNLSGSKAALAADLQLDGDSPGAAVRPTLARKASARAELAAPGEVPGAHTLAARVQDDRGRTLFLGRSDVIQSFLRDRRAGYRLEGRENLGLWWCESGWKTGPDRSPPQATPSPPEPIRVSAAGGEYESAQVFLQPEESGQLLAVQPEFPAAAGGQAPAVSVTVREVAYVHVTLPSDPSCLRGWYPDPLPALVPPLPLAAGRSLALWITFHVSRGAPAGDVAGRLRLRTTLGDLAVPVTVHVYGFALPEQPHLKSAVGINAGDIARYHRLKRPEDRLAVYEKYLEDFAEHRLSPYSFYELAPPDVEFSGEGTNRRARIDFSRFDAAAARWLDGRHFSTFRVPARGMPSGGADHRVPGQIGDHREGSPEYDAAFHDYWSQLEEHLRARKWLPRAYAYWFDEPKPADFSFVAAGMDRLKAAAPGIRRMLTAVPDPVLTGHVDIWCGLTYQWTPEQLAARQSAGDETWWYLATVPKAPYLTEFIDHPGLELRLWPWQSWQYGVTGILLWNAAYWNSTTAFPEPGRQDPWTDPMSYAAGAGLAPGTIALWGNGDGRFLYPARAGAASDPILDGPVDSVRWENLRDGLEDYEYLWLLRDSVQRLASSRPGDSLVGEARALLAVPPGISREVTQFTSDPRLLLARRDGIARMIEQLGKAAPK